VPKPPKKLQYIIRMYYQHFRRNLIAVLAIALLFSPLLAFASSSQGTIDAAHSYAWGENLGWVNFAALSSNVTVMDSGITGYAWSQTYGWINLNPTHGGVMNDGQGNLSGYAWGQDTGWINFQGAVINSSGRFTGIIGDASSTAGRISFDCAQCDVETDWRPQSVRGSSAPVSVGGSSSYGLSINGGASTTATSSVTLSLYGTGAYTMELSNTPSFASSTAISYVTSLPWTLASSTGEQTVFAQFHAVSGSIVGNAEASIDLTNASLPTTVTTTSTAGMSISQLQNLLASLEAELQTLEAEAGTQTSATTPSFTFARNLQLNMTGNDVKQLQQFLIGQNAGPAARKLAAHGTTQNFGSLTKAALIEFQKKAGISPTSGYFGPITRKYVNNVIP
jgi:hypothetical protein